MSQPPLGALRVFEAVARHGSFSRAADEICVTQSAVSHQIRGLEAWFGSPLFERSGNRVTLMPHAAELAAALVRAFGDVDAACRRARRAGGPPILTIAVIPSVAICWLIPRLGHFRAVAPGPGVRVIYALHGQPIDFADVDVAVVFAEAPPVLPATPMATRPAIAATPSQAPAAAAPARWRQATPIGCTTCCCFPAPA